MTSDAVLLAGIPGKNLSLYHQIRFDVHDPVAYIAIGGESTLILRDIELARARERARVDRCAEPAEFAPDGGLSGDREIATAQAAAECLRRAGVSKCQTDRALPMVRLQARDLVRVLRERVIEITTDEVTQLICIQVLR